MLLPATASGLAPRSLLVERTEVSEQPITTYRTSTFGIALLVNDSFCTVVRFCKRSCNFSLHGPLGFEPNNEPVRCCDRSELRPHLPKLRLEDARNQRPQNIPQVNKLFGNYYSRGSWNVTPAAWKNRLGKGGLRGALACWHSGLWAVAQVRVCSSQTRNLSLSFFKLLVTTPWCSKKP